MKKYLILLLLSLLSLNSWSQNLTINNIRENYIETNNKKKDFDVFTFNSPYYDGSIFNDSIFMDYDVMKLIKTDIGSEYTHSIAEYYFENGKVYFIYTRNYSEGHWSETPIPFHVEEYRYYFDENEQIIKILEKKVKGPDAEASNINEIINKTPSVELDPSNHTQYKATLKKAKNYSDSFRKLYNVHYY